MGTMNNRISTRAYVFDYGGTLDTGGCHWGRLLWHAWQEAGVPVSETVFRDAYVYAERWLATHPVIAPDFTFRQTLSAKLQIELQQVGHEEYLQTILDNLYAATCRHTSHSRQVLSVLKRRAPLALVSNFYGNIHTVLHEFSLDGLFSHVVESAVVGLRKPDPAIFLLAAERLGYSPAEITVVGDSIEKDILPAKEAGFLTVWLRGEQWVDAVVDERLPHKTIADLNELL